MKIHVIAIILGTLIIGILIGATAMSMLSEKKIKLFSEIPTKESIKLKVIDKLELDDSQMIKAEPFINDYSDRAYALTRQHLSELLNNFESLYNQMKPFLNENQMQKFEKRIKKIKTEIIK